MKKLERVREKSFMIIFNHGRINHCQTGRVASMGRLRTDYSKNIVPSLELQDLPKGSSGLYDIVSGYLSSSLKSRYGAASRKLYSFWDRASSDTPSPQSPPSLQDHFKHLETEIKKKFNVLKPLDEKVVALRAEKKSIPARLTKKRVAIKEQIDDLLVQKVDASADLIKWHAQRRVDLFFLQLIAVQGLISHYDKTLPSGKTILLQRGQTTLQHGIGSKERGTAGCHASLFPTITAELIDKDESSTESFMDKASSIISSFVSDEEVSNDTIEPEEDKTQKEKTKTIPFILDNTHFQDACNITHEGPMNPFDCVLETKNRQKSPMVEKAEAITNAVFHAEVNKENVKATPKNGLRAFGFYMKLFFDFIEYNYLIKKIDYTPIKPTIPYPKSFKKIWALQKEATLSSFDIGTDLDSTKIKFSYLKMMLGLDSVSDLRKIANLEAVMQEQMDKLQNEILSSPSYRADKKETQEIKARAFSP